MNCLIRGGLGRWLSRWSMVMGLLMAGMAHAQTGTVTYVYTDPQGTPLAEADAQGNITATFDYAPYGSQALGSPPDGPGYTGHVNDPETGLVYMQARYYDPAVGRFLSTDPVGPAAGNPFNFNRYDYANNNPVVNMDPDGRCSSTDPFPCEEFVSGDAGNEGGGGGGSSTSSSPYIPITPQENAANDSGNTSMFWTLRYRGSPRDPWSADGMALWSPNGMDKGFFSGYMRLLATFNLARLDTAMDIRDGHWLFGSNHDVETQHIGVEIMRSYVIQTDRNRGRVPTLTQSDQFHYQTFMNHNLPSGTYGGTPFGYAPSGPLNTWGKAQSSALNILLYCSPGCVK